MNQPKLIKELRVIQVASQALIDDVHKRYPGEDLRCQLMIAIDNALNAITEERGTDLEWLTHFYHAAYDAMGPGAGECVEMIQENFIREHRKLLPANWIDAEEEVEHIALLKELLR